MTGRSRARKRDERGVIAILVAVLSLVILMFAAYAVDIGLQVNRKQNLSDTLDAAAQAGAFRLPGSAIAAKADALSFATAHNATETGSLAPTVDFWCVVASKLNGGSYGVDATQIPATCNPGPSPYTVGANYRTTGRPVACSEKLCAVPCVEPVANTGSPPIACNTIRVYQGRTVPFAFAPAGGIMQGYTGDLLSVACKGSCGTINPNPLDVAVVADRTGSMSSTDVNAMINGIKGMLQQMTPSMQYVALGVIGRASVATTPSSPPGTSCPSSPGTSITSGTWVPVPFSNDYLTSAGAINAPASALVRGVNCLTTQSATGTALASPMKAAARYLLGYASNNLSSLPTRPIEAKKILIFETDGQPNEAPPTGGSVSLSVAGDIFSNASDYTSSGPVSTGPTSITETTLANRTTTTGTTYVDTYNTTYTTTTKTTTNTRTGGQNACVNLNSVATNANAAGILVITIGYNLSGKYCSASNPALPGPTTSDVDGTPTVTSVSPAAAEQITNGVKSVKQNYTNKATVTQTATRTRNVTNWNSAPDNLVNTTLAAAASPVEGVPSMANNSCSTAAQQLAENSDGDYFFCAASGTDMAPIFKTALSQATKGIKLP